MTADRSPFFRRAPDPAAAMRLFCLPYAGGGASLFRQWPLMSPPGLDISPVHLPGRETRITEPAIAEASVLTPMLLDALRPHVERRYALFGHSLGAMLAFALARAIEDENLPRPELLVLAACSPESIRPAEPPRASWSDGQLLEYVRKIGGTPDQMLADPELRALVLPRLRADFSLVDTLFPLTIGDVSSPILAFAGERDRGVPAKQMKAWRERTSGSFSIHVLSGDHFFPAQPGAARQILETAWRQLQPAAARSRRWA